MRETLSDILRQSGSLFSVLRVTGTDEETKVDATNENRTLFLKAKFKSPVKEFNGVFGISNLGLLSGLLNVYKADSSTFSVTRTQKGEREIVELFTFSASEGGKAIFRLMNPDVIPSQADLNGSIPWDVEFVPDKIRLNEFQTLSSLYGEVEKTFMPRSRDGHLFFYVGNENSSTHSASMVFQPNVTGELKGDLRYQTAQFISVMKLAGANNAVLSLTSRGVMKISVETTEASYDYYIRSERG